jgi:hypothetical protein
MSCLPDSRNATDSKLAPNRIQMYSKSTANGLQIDSKCAPNGPQMYSKWTPNVLQMDSKSTPKRPQMDSIDFRWTPNRLQLNPKRLQTDSHLTANRLQKTKIDFQGNVQGSALTIRSEGCASGGIPAAPRSSMRRPAGSASQTLLRLSPSSPFSAGRSPARSRTCCGSCPSAPRPGRRCPPAEWTEFDGMRKVVSGPRKWLWMLCTLVFLKKYNGLAFSGRCTAPFTSSLNGAILCTKPGKKIFVLTRTI